jgi:hypothetical protein
MGSKLNPTKRRSHMGSFVHLLSRRPPGRPKDGAHTDHFVCTCDLQGRDHTKCDD